MNPSSIRRFVFTLITGYLAIFGVQRLPYEFDNQWAVLIPVLVVVYILTVLLDGLIFKEDKPEIPAPKASAKKEEDKEELCWLWQLADSSYLICSLIVNVFN